MTLQPTLDTEITTIEHAISDEIKHISRKMYVSIVDPLKKQKIILIEQNKIIKIANKIIMDTPTAEELTLKAANEKKENIKNEIELSYSQTETMAISMAGLASILPDNTDVQNLNTVINNAQIKYA